MLSRVRTLVVKFKNNIFHQEVPLFRGAVISTIEKDVNLLYHNHLQDGYNYHYPKIQYKRINGKAAIMGIDEGIEALSQFLKLQPLSINVGKRELLLEIESVLPNQIFIAQWNARFTYSLRKWLPLNSTNYSAFSKIEGLGDRVDFLESILTANILSLAKGLNIHFDEKVFVSITNIESTKLLNYKGVKMMGFDILFKTNVSFPNYIGVGKGVSLGFGLLHRMKE